MASPRTILQTIEKSYSSPLEKAVRYYTVLSVLNNLGLPPAEIRLLAFTAIRGNIASWSARLQFMEDNNTSRASVANMVHKLYKRGLLIKEDGKTIVHPMLALDFTNPLLLKISLQHEQSS